MPSRSASPFTCIATEGALLPSDTLERIFSGSGEMEGLSAGAYGLAPGERTRDAIARSWSRLTGLWATFRKHVEGLPAHDLATGATRERWLLPLFDELGYGRLPPHRAVEIEGKAYPVSHMWHHTPLHLVGCRIDLDKRVPGAVGAARTSPHSLIQEFLNRSPTHLWAIVTNGLKLRLLRDNVSFTRQSYVEFDLEAIMEGEVYSDFIVLWLVCHATRLFGERHEQCWLETWSKDAQERGTRALDSLRDGVERAITALGGGFLARGLNPALKEKLNSGALDKQDFYRQLLRIVYRLLFLFVAEDRNLLLAEDAPPEARERYEKWYSTRYLRNLSRRPRTGGKHVDLGRMLFLVFQKMESGCPELAISPLGGFLWSRDAIADLAECDIRNENLLAALRALAWTRHNGVPMQVDFRNLGAEELGSVYESLLELHPELNPTSGHFELSTAAGHERKSTGSYYTPTSLITCLLDSALDPVLEEAARKEHPEDAILKLKVCDPACGSGHFLVAAAHRIAKRLASARTGDEEPDPTEIRRALRDVIGHCIYGVDINPMSVELCKVSLWMEAMEPGKPLSFLDHHIQCGNSLIGATPRLLEDGIPDEAFKPIEGDDKAVCKDFGKTNRDYRKGRQGSLFEGSQKFPWERLGNLPSAMMKLEQADDSTVEAVKAKEAEYERLVHSSGYAFGRLLADAWCAAFVWRKIDSREHPYPVTQELFAKIEHNPHSLSASHKEEIQRLAAQYRFFHFHLAFPEVFRIPVGEAEPENGQTGWSGGFDCVLGNPPWERIKLQEKEWFAERCPGIANAPNAAARGRMIQALKREDPAVYGAFLDAKRQAEGESVLARGSGLYPLCGRGDVNTYTIFAELKRSLLSRNGRVGCIVPSGIATDDTTKFFFQEITDTGALVSLCDFENRRKIFPGIDSRIKFCLLTMAGRGRPVGSAADFVFFALDTADLADEERHFTLSAEDIALINPNTRTCPIFRRKQDAELTKWIYRRVPVLIKEGDAENGIPDENPWGIRFMTMFHMSNDSGLFRTHAELEGQGLTLDGNRFLGADGEYFPLYEAKMIHHFDHRWATYQPDGSTRDMTPDEKANPDCLPMPRYWVEDREVYLRIARLPRPLVNALRKCGTDAILHELAFLLFAVWLHDSGMGDAGGDIPALRPAWGTFVEANGFASEAWFAGGARSIESNLAGAEGYAALLPARPPLPSTQDALDFAEAALKATSPKWLMGWRDITNSTNERTVIAGATPIVGLSNKLPIMEITEGGIDPLLLYAELCSFAHDYSARQKIGGTTLNYFIYKQLPSLTDKQFMSCSSLERVIRPLTLELILTSYQSTNVPDLGYDGPPFKWNESRRFLIRCELDAAFFHLYLGTKEEWRENASDELLHHFPTPRHAVEYILETFPIVKRKDIARTTEKDAGGNVLKEGSFLTKDTILDLYDRMTDVIAENRAAEAAGHQSTARFKSTLVPPPGPPTDAEGNFIPYAEWTPDIHDAYKDIIHPPKGDA